MGNFRKWNSKGSERLQTTDELHVMMFVSRNKDNKTVDGYEERRKVFLTTKAEDDEVLLAEFDTFASLGVKGERSRMYRSVNARSQEGTQNALMHYLLDNNVNVASLPALAVRVAMSKENAVTKRRLFDFDVNDERKVKDFVQDLVERGVDEETVHVYKTPNGYAVVMERGADLRGLVDTMPDQRQVDKKDKGPWKWTKEEVGYKFDDLVLVKWADKV